MKQTSMVRAALERLPGLSALALMAACSHSGPGPESMAAGSESMAAGPESMAAGPDALPSEQGAALPPTYRVYVANESSDVVTRVAFTPGSGAVIEAEIPVGIRPVDIDGTHGLTVSPDGEYWFVSIAHGTPYGYVWKFKAGADTLVGQVTLGYFPATMGISPDGNFLVAANFALHGDMVPSSLSVVYTPTMTEVDRITTCLMPHGSRVNSVGNKHYSACMHSDQLVELDLGSLEITARYSVAPGHERSLDLGDLGERHSGAAAGVSDMPVCSPTWVEPATGPRANTHVYVACNKNGQIIEIDVRSWVVTRRFPTGKAPYNLDVTASGDYLVASLKGEQKISVFDLETGEEVGRLQATRPVTHGVVISPDGEYVFVTNEAVGATPGTLDIFHLAHLERVASLELRQQPGGVDFWTMTEPQ